MREWLSGGLSAGRLATNRADLWFPGALVSFAFAGWAVLLAVVMSPVDEGDFLFFGVRLVSSDAWPSNALALAGMVLAGAGVLLLAIGYGETVLLDGLAEPGRQGAPRGVGRAAGVLGLATTPVVVLGLALAWLLAPTFVDEFQHPDPLTPYLVRVVTDAWPALLMLVLGAVAAQACGALALRTHWADAQATARGRLGRILAQTAITTAAFVGAQAAAFATLSTLWAPLTDRLGQGRLTEPSTAILLLGFVWIWLVLVILAGVLQVWITAWWNVTLAQRPGG